MFRNKKRRALVMGMLGGGAAAAPAFAPTDLPGLALWLDASDADTLFQDAAGTTPATDEDHPVGLWKDKTANAYNAAQATDGTRPLLKTNVQNSLPGVRGISNDSMSFAGTALGLFRNKAYAAIFAIYTPGQTAQADRRLMSFARGGHATQVRVGLGEGGTAQRAYLSARRVDADTAVTITSDTDHGGTVHCFTAMLNWTGGTLALRQDGVQVATGNFAASGNTSDTDSVNAALFSDPNGSSAFSIGTLHELVVYTQALTAPQITQVETYLKTKWGLSF